MTTNAAQLLRECLQEYQHQHDDAVKRLAKEQRASVPDKKRVARLQRAVEWALKQIDTTRAALAREEGETS